MNITVSFKAEDFDRLFKLEDLLNMWLDLANLPKIDGAKVKNENIRELYILAVPELKVDACKSVIKDVFSRQKIPMEIVVKETIQGERF